MSKFIKNIGSITGTFHDKLLSPGEYYEIIEDDYEVWARDTRLVQAVLSGSASLSFDGLIDLNTEESLLLLTGSISTIIGDRFVDSTSVNDAHYLVFTSGSNRLEYKKRTTINGLSGPININAGPGVNVDSFGVISISSSVPNINDQTGSVRITSGPNIVINSGSEQITVSASITSINTLSGALNLTAGPNIVIDNDGSNFSITSSAGTDPDNFVGVSFERVLIQAGTTKNKWLNLEQGMVNSHATPVVIPFKSKLSSLTFSNSDAGISTDVQIYKSVSGAGNANSVVFTWAIRNTRVAHKSNFTASIIFEPGDKVGVFLKEYVGNNEAKDPALHLMFRGIVGAITGSSNENYSGNF